MPHVIVKLFAGRSPAQKQKIADEVTKVIMSTANCGEDAVSVGIEDIAPADWEETVFLPDIAGKAATLYKKPGGNSV